MSLISVFEHLVKVKLWTLINEKNIENIDHYFPQLIKVDEKLMFPYFQNIFTRISISEAVYIIGELEKKQLKIDCQLLREIRNYVMHHNRLVDLILKNQSGFFQTIKFIIEFIIENAQSKKIIKNAKTHFFKLLQYFNNNLSLFIDYHLIIQIYDGIIDLKKYY
ncbi:hypothetical protein [Ureaplasma canigenitalium]|uniref:hypothetical protein n=1 Tax=Ureaplasma canigenitalium TaxID=42092 RepID=UPI0004E17EEF|nr:hypothetical protein [Ureaplasma canigenitalium]